MRSYPFLSELFKNILAKSKAIQGRFFFCPKLGNELNSDELGQVILDEIAPQRLFPKYPLVVAQPPMSFGHYSSRSVEWENNLFVMFFLKTTYNSSSNQITNPNPSTRTSTHTVPEDWHDMKRCAVNFIRVLDQLSREKRLINTSFRLHQERHKTIRPVSFIGADNLSGVRLEFYGSVFLGCDMEDYVAADIATIEIPVEDSHPEHQL